MPCLTQYLYPNVNSTSNLIGFDVNNDGILNASLTPLGLSLGQTTARYNLDVTGNAIVQNELSIGGSLFSSSSNLNISGTMAFSVNRISTNTIVNHSMNLVDSSGSNLILTLPYAGNVDGRIVTLKKICSFNDVYAISKDGYIDDSTALILPTGTLASVDIIAAANNWNILASSFGAETHLSDNLIAWYKLDESIGSGTFAEDSSQHNQHGAHNSSDMTGGNGIINLGANYTGSKITAISGERVNYSGSSFTMMCWIKPISINTTMTLISKSNDYTLYIRNTNVPNCIFPDLTDGNINSTSGDTITLNEWNHVAASYDGSSVRTYLNGNIQQTKSAYGSIIANSEYNLNLSKGGGGLTGEMDDVRLYDKALSQKDMAIIYASRRY